MGWKYHDLKDLLLCDAALPQSYTEPHEYGLGFENLIYEEARAVLVKGNDEPETDKNHSKINFGSYYCASRKENPAKVSFLFYNRSLFEEVNAGDVFLLKKDRWDRNPIIALFSEKEKLKVVFNLFANENQVEEKQYAKKIGSILNLQRMYEACNRFKDEEKVEKFFDKLTFLEKNILLGKLADGPQRENVNLDLLEEDSELNPSQKNAIKEFIELKEGVSLIQGPPGTGKTTTVVKLLQQLCLQQKKILACAPSNKAIHELAARFIEKYPDIPVLLVGVEEKLPPGSRLNDIFMDLWIDGKTKALLEMRKKLHDFYWKYGKKWSQSAGEEITILSKEISRNLSQLVDEFKKYKITCVDHLDEEKVKILLDLCEDLQAQKEHLSIDSELRVKLSALSTHLSFLIMELCEVEENGELEKKLFENSQIIFTTLSVSGQQRLKSRIKSVDVLVIDEAGQAVEAETLIPMWTEPEKCLLVGDIKQLPAMVVSEKAKSLGFGRSMMERLQDCGHAYSMLTLQYRIHPEISSWPSRFYYDGKLEDASSVHGQILKGTSFPFLAPYFFIDIDDGVEEAGPKGHSWMNRQEAVAIALIVDHLASSLMIDIEQNVSVISFYSLTLRRMHKNHLNPFFAHM